MIALVVLFISIIITCCFVYFSFIDFCGKHW